MIWMMFRVEVSEISPASVHPPDGPERWIRVFPSGLSGGPNVLLAGPDPDFLPSKEVSTGVGENQGLKQGRKQSTLE